MTSSHARRLMSADARRCLSAAALPSSGSGGCSLTHAIQCAHMRAVCPLREVAYSTRSACALCCAKMSVSYPSCRSEPRAGVSQSIARAARGSQQSAAAMRQVHPTLECAAGSAPSLTARVSIASRCPWLASELRPRYVEAEGISGERWRAVASGGGRWRAVASVGERWRGVARSGEQQQAAASSGEQWRAAAISGNQWRAVASNSGHQRTITCGPTPG